MAIKVLANDGIDDKGKQMLEEAGFEVDTQKVPQEELANSLNNYDAVIVRSATQIRKEQIDVAPNLKFIGRAGVGLDNIDVEYAESKGKKVANTPSASSLSVAELVFSHLFGMVRFLHDANRQMPGNGIEKFKDLKKKYSNGMELRGKTLGIIGLGRIGAETARIGLGIGMKVIACGHDPNKKADIEINLPPDQCATITLHKVSREEVLRESDFISIHTPGVGEPILTKEDFQKMKDGVGIINCARGGVIKEAVLLEMLNSGKVAFAGIDVFEEEPTNNKELLQHPNVSLTPHIGASTVEAQERIGIEMAQQLIDFFK